MPKPDCSLCQSPGGVVLWQHPSMRVIDACDPLYPGFTRVVWNAHVKEMTDLTPSDQLLLMQGVLMVESVQRSVLKPDKINLAAFGNVVPHLHWHIIPRWCDDAHFPQPVWASQPQADAASKQKQAQRRTKTRALLDAYHGALTQQLNAAIAH